MKLKLIRLAQKEFDGQMWGVQHGLCELRPESKAVKFVTQPFLVHEHETPEKVVQKVREAISNLVCSLTATRFDLVQLTPLGHVDVDTFHIPEHRAYSVKIWVMGYEA